MVRLETGDTGIAVTAESDGTLYSSIFGIENYVVSTGNMFKAEIQSNNKIKVSDGSAIMNGRHIRIPSGDSELVTIDNGSQGMNRIDLIVLRYKKNSAGVESGELVVIKGMETSDVAKTPDFTHGDILTGAAQADFPLYEVELNGINIINLRSLFETVGNITGLEKQMSTINKYLSQLQSYHDKKTLTPTDLGLNTATWKTIANNSYKIGKTIHLNMEFYTIAIIVENNVYNNIFTIPSQYRPLIDTVVNVIASDGTYKNPVACTAMVKANGNLFICIPKATNNYLFIDAEWECA